MSNPLLVDSNIPLFQSIEIEHFAPAMAQRIEESRTLIDELCELEEPTWENFYLPFQEASEKLHATWWVVNAYNAVMNTPELVEVYQSLLPELSRFSTDVSQNERLYRQYEKLASSDAYETFSEAQKSALGHTLRDFKLGGVALQGDDKTQYKELSERKSKLCNAFAQNVLDTTQAWSLLVQDEADLIGVPDSTKVMLAESAKAQGHETGYLLTLDMPCYLPLISYAENRSLRETLYKAYITRASTEGDHDPSKDNSDLMHDILEVRKSMAKLVGFEHYAAYSLAPKMAETAEEVIEFLEGLSERSKPFAETELNDIRQAALSDGIQDLASWDLNFYKERLKAERFGFSKEEIRQYLPLSKVLEGLFSVVKTLFGVDIQARETVDLYHNDARYYAFLKDGEEVAGAIIDLFARKGKRGGAWLSSAKHRHIDSKGTLHLPLGHLVCNFTPPQGDQDSLLTPEEVTTLFHEFGHCLHHTLTSVEVVEVSGISNVPWDAVELPSQMLENWCWQPEVLPLISAHVETGEAMPQALAEKLQASDTFQEGLAMLRQLEFAWFDIELHRNYQNKSETDIQGVLDQVREKVSLLAPPEYAKFQNTFSHIFAGGYAAGYYSYKWAEVLSSDAFSRFEEEGVLNPEVGKSFLDEFLSRGGTRPVMEMFSAFRGRKPTQDALLRHSGLVSA